jgi:preprotein translocase SecE subunit
MKGEFKKINWTTKGELVSNTKIVVLSTLLFALGIYFADMIIRGVYLALQMLVRW